MASFLSHSLRAHPILRWVVLACLVLLVGSLAGCAEIGQMRDQPKYNPLEESQLFADGRSARPIPEGSVPFAREEGDSPNNPALTGTDGSGEPVEGFPVPVNQALMESGQKRFTIFCTPCHGPTGEGNGRAIPYGVPKPPSLLSEDTKARTSGEIFDIITNGTGNMFPYGYRVKPDERWAVIAYLRAMQLKNGAVDVSALTADDLSQIENVK